MFNKAKAVGAPPSPRSGHSATLSGTKMIVFGGATGTGVGFSNELFIFHIDTLTWQTIQPNQDSIHIPSPRANHMASLNEAGMLVVFGGYDGATMSYSNEVFELDVNSFVWYKPILKGPNPAPRESATMDLVRGMLWVFGGYTSGMELNDLFVLDMEALTWQKAES